MQTVLQELISELKRVEDYPMMPFVIRMATDLLEKEKEQIIDAYDRGYKACDLDETLEINKTMFSGERYYEQAYKPETI
jgi:hypothetical protein